ncbi:MAG: hypothetical protein KAG98_03725 [Lentisphaeria bacterium]|nr:hypothetical protein [Lentisphaeria bacterium]
MDIKKLVGILDIGSNSTMLTISTTELPCPEFIGELCEVTRLAEGVDQTGFLNDVAMARTRSAIINFVREAKMMGVSEFFGTATSAVRDAKNGAEFIESIFKAVGFKPEILEGQQEADTVFLGTTADLRIGQKVITCDPGGGSTEINIGEVGKPPFYGKSFNIGCVRQGDRFGLYENTTPEQIEQAKSEIKSLLTEAFQQVDPSEYTLIISAGTATTYGAMDLGLSKYKNHKVHLMSGKKDGVESWIEKLFKMTINERAELPGVGARAATIPAGLLIMNEVLAGFNKTEFRISTNALRHGVLLKACQKLQT